MGVNGIGASGYPMGYTPQKTERNHVEENVFKYVMDGKGTKFRCGIAWGRIGRRRKVVTAWACVTENTSMTVYQPNDFDPAHPVYKVKVWDANGNVTERMVDISEVDPSNCDTIDMYAYSAYLSKSGKYPDALTKFMMAHAHHKDMSEGYGSGNLFDKVDWLGVIKRVMKMQYDAGNLSGYLEYKKFLEFLEGEKTGKGEKVSSDEEESKVETNIHVEPDGARVLVMTRKMGGMQTTTSIELSKPTKSPYEQSGQEGGRGRSERMGSSRYQQCFGAVVRGVDV